MRPARSSTSGRADARRNREAILRVADEAYAEGSEVVPLDEIARRAGLGRATVYRHFPDRRSLGLAVATERLAWLSRVDATGEVCSFRELLLMVLSVQVERRSLVNLFRNLPNRYQQQYAEALISVLKPAFERAREQGDLRPDIELNDLVLVFEMVEAALLADFACVHGDESTQRLINVIVDGLFVRPGA
ncbi:Transcriptional regulator, TetR family [Actinokineospora spheciospongiae]|uniref:Transcriptional regulator, TetR family n=1 Tax=Actinokineospora spheciospongiae TaxID=909613 RepID=W7INW8_9PSEU|nr:TetR/AcrR family transcriptional regulator [Actinokineospora spheciospongiae]EWC58256.1 Transcriptional regulator, TetR family [Actinokineospora spheciospongiae]PWW67156.1 TetR family transcriptional regulator [Actinokineospora spheciospongiae]